MVVPIRHAIAMLRWAEDAIPGHVPDAEWATFLREARAAAADGDTVRACELLEQAAGHVPSAAPTIDWLIGLLHSDARPPA